MLISSYCFSKKNTALVGISAHGGQGVGGGIGVGGQASNKQVKEKLDEQLATVY